MQLPRDLVWRNEYALGPLGVATTIPAPGSGTGSMYFVSLPPFAALAPGSRTVHGTASAAPAPSPYCRKRRRVIGFMPFPSRSGRRVGVRRPTTGSSLG